MSQFIRAAVAVCLFVVATPPLVGQGVPPEAAANRMTVAEGFEVKLVASEPLVRQPVCIEFDDRGRLWVIQYLQYPNPAELKRVQVDRFSRTRYDRVPEPPPRGPRGADRITILEDSDGDGVMDQGRDFVTGLNLTSGLAFGHGGVFVLSVPYLLFYPDRNRDDVPDGDPEVLLTGFGMEDAHSVANSLTWGPDGWLYGCQGSTVTANIRGIEFQQGVWRYHPVSREFELFCEGGGNSWGLDFDRAGRLLYSTNWGGHVLLHGVPGAYLVKSFSKHGALHNPFAFGYFDHAPHQNFRGGHVTVGGIIYQGDAFPEKYRDKYMAGDLLGHGVYWHDVTPRGSTVQTAHGGELLVANDTWFAPTDVTLGPEGAVYVSDWHDARTAHPDPDADWDRTNGRIYRIAPVGTKPAPKIDLAKRTNDELLGLHDHRSQWFVRRVRQELVRRRDNSVVEALRERAIKGPHEPVALEALWTLASLGLFDETLADTLLTSPHPAVRGWTIRLLGDRRRISSEMAHRLDKLAETESSIDVRQQLACAAARFPAAQAMPIINANINRDSDSDDPYLPLLWWWAVEKHSVTGREEVMKRFLRPSLWKSRLGREALLTRLIRRYTAEGTREGLDSVVRLLKSAPNVSARDSLWMPILLGWRDFGVGIPADSKRDFAGEFDKLRDHEFASQVLMYWQLTPDHSALWQLGIELGFREPNAAALSQALDPKMEAARRVELLGYLSRSGIALQSHPPLIVSAPNLLSPLALTGFDNEATDKLLSLVRSDPAETVRVAAMKTVSRIPNPKVSSALIDIYQASTTETFRSAVRTVLLGQRDSAWLWLQAVEQRRIVASETPLEQVRQIALLKDPELDKLVIKHWGRLEGATREEKLAEVRRLNNDLRAAPGNAITGKALYKKHCAACHPLFGQGTKLGPDLTTANRLDRDALLVSLVDPSSVIRREYLSYIVQTKSGRVVTGMAIARDDSQLTLVNAKNEKTIIPTADVDELQESNVSLMPDDLYRQLKPQELRDLFAYLQSKGDVE